MRVERPHAHRWPVVGIVGLDRDLDLIAPTPHVTCRRPFIDRLAEAGCLPVVIPPRSEQVERYLDLLDGLLLPGGGDIDPSVYGQLTHPAVSWVDTERDLAEVALTRAALAEDIPVLGVCRGLQVLNVALNGTLIQHIPDVHPGLNHNDVQAWNRPVHAVHVKPDSKIASMYAATEIHVNSIHHQAIDRPGEGLEVTARSEDGLPEGIESRNHFYAVGVQWHPELMAAETHSGPFQRLAEAVKERVRQERFA